MAAREKGVARSRPPQPSHSFRAVDRPQVALITNHGYGGVEIPMAGAPDTGGQNLYVNSMAQALASLGYRVTVFARGGFPNFDSTGVRGAPEYLSEHIRYVFVPGGGSHFIRKEEIAVALDEELEWLDDFVRREATECGRQPWELYEFVNSHYWDGAVLGERLVERWRDDLVADTFRNLLQGILQEDALEQFWVTRHWRAVGESPHYHLGRLLIAGSELVPLRERAHRGADAWTLQQELPENDTKRLADRADQALEWARQHYPPPLWPMVVADAMGEVALSMLPDACERLKLQLQSVDRHVWTPHSLGDLKDWNFRNRPRDVRREMRFCERRSHERMVCQRTRHFAATSSDIAEILHTHLGVPVDRIFYFPPCIDTARFREYSDEEHEPAYRYLEEVSGVPAEKLREGRILFETSRMDSTKRKDLVLSAFARIAEEFPDTYLFIGGGPENDLLRSLEQQIEYTDALKERAWLTRPIPDEHMGPLFSLCDVYATASEMEGFGMSVAQAAASGTLVVSSDCIPFSVHHAPETCVIFRAGDVRHMAEALTSALRNEQARRQRTRALVGKVRQLNWKKKTSELIDHLRQRGMQVEAGRT